MLANSWLLNPLDHVSNFRHLRMTNMVAQFSEGSDVLTSFLKGSVRGTSLPDTSELKGASIQTDNVLSLQIIQLRV